MIRLGFYPAKVIRNIFLYIKFEGDTLYLGLWLFHTLADAVVQRPWTCLDSLSYKTAIKLVLPADLQGCNEIKGFSKGQSIILAW